MWIRKGIEARRTRDEGRVRRLGALRDERGARRERMGNVKLALDAGERSGRLVAELEGVSKRFGERTMVRDLTLRVMRGDRLGADRPQRRRQDDAAEADPRHAGAGRGHRAARHQAQVAYFDQMRAQLDPERTLADTISPGGEWVEVAAAGASTCCRTSAISCSRRSARTRR